MKRDKATRIAEEDGLCSLSNNSKWQGLLEALRAFPTQKRIKFIDVEAPGAWHASLWQPHSSYVEGSLMGPEELKFVEWLEILHEGKSPEGRVKNYSAAILLALQNANVVFQEGQTSFVIFGYSRPGN